jgi:hypothetical protein
LQRNTSREPERSLLSPQPAADGRVVHSERFRELPERVARAVGLRERVLVSTAQQLLDRRSDRLTLPAGHFRRAPPARQSLADEGHVAEVDLAAALRQRIATAEAGTPLDSRGSVPEMLRCKT